MMLRGLALAALLLQSSQAATNVEIPAFVPGGASPPIDPSFAGLAFEETSFLQYAGPAGSPNQFSVNLLNAIASRTNTQPVIRVGGTSLDRARYIRSQNDAVDFPPGQTGNVPSGVTIGPKYFKSFANFPSARYIVTIPLATNNITNSVQFAQDAYPVIGKQVYGLEIGNEPGFYPGSVRDSSYSPQDYVAQFTSFSNAVNNALDIPRSKPIYEAVALGSPFIFETTNNAATPGPFYPINLFWVGLGSISSNFMSVSMHYYQTRAKDGVSGTTQLQTDLLNHTITTRKTAFFQPAIQYFRNNYPSIPINLAEVASSLNGATNDYGLESVFGAALWQVDWMLWCAYIGINRINWQQISASAFDLWQPTTYKNRPPAVLPPFYAMLFVTDFIGADGAIRVSNINLNNDRLTAYASYGPKDRLRRIALVNMNFFSGIESANNPRGTRNFRLSLPKTVKRVQIVRMSSTTGATGSTGSGGGNDEGDGITWMGQQYTYESNGTPRQVKQDTTTLPVRKGNVVVPVRASEAVQVICIYR